MMHIQLLNLLEEVSIQQMKGEVNIQSNILELKDRNVRMALLEQIVEFELDGVDCLAGHLGLDVEHTRCFGRDMEGSRLLAEFGHLRGHNNALLCKIFVREFYWLDLLLALLRAIVVKNVLKVVVVAGDLIVEVRAVFTEVSERESQPHSLLALLLANFLSVCHLK